MRPADRQARIDRATEACRAVIAGAEAMCRILAMPEASMPTRHGRARATGRPTPRRRHVEGLPSSARTVRLARLGAALLAITSVTAYAQLAATMAAPIRGHREVSGEIIILHDGAMLRTPRGAHE